MCSTVTYSHLVLNSGGEGGMKDCAQEGAKTFHVKKIQHSKRIVSDFVVANFVQDCSCT